MLFSKKKIFNKDLRVIATQICVKDGSGPQNANEIEMFSNFLNILVEEVDRTYKKVRLIIPKDFISFVDELPQDIAKRITIKVDLRSSDKDSADWAKKLVDDGYNVAVDIHDRRALGLLPPTYEFIIIDKVFVSLMSEDDLLGVDFRKLIVKNIEEYESYEEMKERGAAFFTGNFIEKPKDLKNSTMSANKLIVLNLLTTLNDPDVELSDVSQVITSDNVLSYKLLRIVNSPLFRGVKELTSIQDAIVRFGYNNLKKWGLMLSLCSISDKPTELTKMTLERAIMCANLAEAVGGAAANREAYYTTGLFSTLDAFFDSPMESLLNEIELANSVKMGILSHKGETGDILRQVINYQRGDLKATNADFADIFLESNREASETFLLLGLKR